MSNFLLEKINEQTTSMPYASFWDQVADSMLERNDNGLKLKPPETHVFMECHGSISWASGQSSSFWRV